MSVVAKVCEGKRKNLGGMGLYERRVIAAVLSFNTTGFFANEIAKDDEGKVANKMWDAQADRTRKRRHQLRTRAAKRVKLTFKFLGNRVKGDRDYGDNPAEPDINEGDLQIRIQQEWENLQVDAAQQKAIEQQTREQANNSHWFDHRKYRITASNAGKIFSLGDGTDNSSTLKSILGQQKIAGRFLKNLDFGRQHEDDAVKAYEEKFPANGKTRTCGLFVSLDNGIYGASPDRLIGDGGLLEVKCAASISKMDPNDWPEQKKSAYCPLKKDKNSGTVSLKRNHAYFYQCVMQIIVADKQFCDFFVWTPVGSFCERIGREEAVLVWEKMEPKLRRFWFNDLAPELFNSRLSRKYKCRQPSYRQDAIKQLADNRKARKESLEAKQQAKSVKKLEQLAAKQAANKERLAAKQDPKQKNPKSTAKPRITLKLNRSKK